VHCIRYQDHLCCSLGDGSDTLILSNWFTSDAYKIRSLEFADGTAWDVATITSKLPPSNTQPGESDPGNPQPWVLDTSGTGVLIGGGWVDLPYAFQGTWVNVPISEVRRIVAFTGYWAAQKAAGDTSSPTPVNKTIQGSAYDDFLYGGAGHDKLYGYDGNDYLSGGAGHDKLYGGTGPDLLYGGNGQDWLYGEEGDDYLSAGEDDWGNYLFGDIGQDRLVGGNGGDYLDGGYGDDVLDGGDGDDTLTDDGDNNTLRQRRRCR